MTLFVKMYTENASEPQTAHMHRHLIAVYAVYAVFAVHAVYALAGLFT